MSAYSGILLLSIKPQPRVAPTFAVEFAAGGEMGVSIASLMSMAVDFAGGGEFAANPRDPLAFVARFSGGGEFTADVANASDEYWDQVVLLMGFDDQADGSTVFVDESSYNQPIVTAGGAVATTTSPLVSSGSLSLDGVGDYLEVDGSATTFSVANDTDWTMEFTIRTTDLSHINTIISKRPASGAAEFAAYVNTSGLLSIQVFASGSATAVATSATGAIVVGQTYKVAIVRANGDTWYLFIDGILVGTAVEGAQPSFTGQEVHIGRDPFNTGRDFEGQIDEIRITAGVARYTSNYTPETRFVRPGEAVTYSSFSLSIPAQSEELIGFPVMVDLSTFPLAFWDTYIPDGIRVYGPGGTRWPIDIVSIDTVARTGRAFFKGDLSSVSSTVVTIETTDTTSTTHGKADVWSDYDMMLAFPDYTNRASAGGTFEATNVGTGNIEFGETLFNPPTHQGLAHDPVTGNFICVDTDRFYLYGPDYVLITSTGSKFAETGLVGVNHFGDGTVHNGELYVPTEEYTNSPYDNQHITVWDPVTLAFIRSHDISANLHEVSSITRMGDQWVITEFTDTGDSRLHIYNDDFTYNRAQAHGGVIEDKQGIVFHDGYLWVSRSHSTSGRGYVYRVDPIGSTWPINLVWYGIPTGTNSGTMEGLTSDGENLYAVFDPVTGDTVAFRFDNTYHDWLRTPGDTYYGKMAVPRRTVWTIGCNFVSMPQLSSGHQVIMSVSTDTTVDTTRASLTRRDVTGMGIATWNSSNTWYDPAGTQFDTVDGVEYHATLGHNGTSGRQLSLNEHVSTGATAVATRPGGSTQPYIFFGVEDLSAGEEYGGVINYAYQRPTYLSPAWLAAEGLNWSNPGAFYTIVVEGTDDVDTGATLTPTFISSSTVVTTHTTTADIPAPAGLAVGDLMIVTPGRTDPADPATRPAGWSHTNFQLAFWKFADASDVAASSFPFPIDNAFAYETQTIMSVYRNVDPTTPVVDTSERSVTTPELTVSSYPVTAAASDRTVFYSFRPGGLAGGVTDITTALTIDAELVNSDGGSLSAHGPASVGDNTGSATRAGASGNAFWTITALLLKGAPV